MDGYCSLNSLEMFCRVCVYMTLAAAAALCCPQLEYYANRVGK